MTDNYEKTIKVSELPIGSMKTVDVKGEKVLLVNSNGRYYGICAICTHEEWDLSEGTLEGTKVTCAGHGAIWDLISGKGEFNEELDDEPLYAVKAEKEYLYVKRK